MKKSFAILKLMSSLIMVPFSALANSVDCPDSVKLVLGEVGLNYSTGLDTTAPNGYPIRIYQDLPKGVLVEASASEYDWSYIIVKYQNSSMETNDFQFSFENCKLSTIVANKRQSNGNHISQTSASAKFCLNLNNGRKPTLLNEQYLEFDDGSGNASLRDIDKVKAMCKDSAIYLKY